MHAKVLKVLSTLVFKVEIFRLQIAWLRTSEDEGSRLPKPRQRLERDSRNHASELSPSLHHPPSQLSRLTVEPPPCDVMASLTTASVFRLPCGVERDRGSATSMNS